MDNSGMSRVSGESMDTLPGGGGALYRLASTDNPGISGVSGESMKGHQTTDSVLGQPCNSHNSDDHYHPALV